MEPLDPQEPALEDWGLDFSCHPCGPASGTCLFCLDTICGHVLALSHWVVFYVEQASGKAERARPGCTGPRSGCIVLWGSQTLGDVGLRLVPLIRRLLPAIASDPHPQGCHLP